MWRDVCLANRDYLIGELRFYRAELDSLLAMIEAGAAGNVVGLSCCQAEDLLNRKSDLYERIDLIFSLAPPRKVQEARLLGESISDKTLPVGKGLWPSDHASVGARLQY